MRKVVALAAGASRETSPPKNNGSLNPPNKGYQLQKKTSHPCVKSRKGEPLEEDWRAFVPLNNQQQGYQLQNKTSHVRTVEKVSFLLARFLGDLLCKRAESPLPQEIHA